MFLDVPYGAVLPPSQMVFFYSKIMRTIIIQLFPFLHIILCFFLTSLVEFHSSIVFLGARKLVSSKHFCNGDSTIGVIIVSVHSISDAEKKKLCLGERSILSSFFFIYKPFSMGAKLLR